MFRSKNVHRNMSWIKKSVRHRDRDGTDSVGNDASQRRPRTCTEQNRKNRSIFIQYLSSICFDQIGLFPCVWARARTDNAATQSVCTELWHFANSSGFRMFTWLVAVADFFSLPRLARCIFFHLSTFNFCNLSSACSHASVNFWCQRRATSTMSCTIKTSKWKLHFSALRTSTTTATTTTVSACTSDSRNHCVAKTKVCILIFAEPFDANWK